MRFLLDTCVLSEPFRREPNRKVMEWLRSVDQTSLYTPAVVIGELRKGLAKMPECNKKTTLANWIDDYLAYYSGNIVPFDSNVAVKWGDLVGKLETSGKRPPVIDSQIAATALYHGMTLVTRNVQDMEATGVAILNPFNI